MTRRTDLAEAVKAVSPKAELAGKTSKTVDAALLNKAVLLDITYRMWSNRCKADRRPEDESGAPRKRTNGREKGGDRFNLTMRMVESDAYNAIVTRNNEVRAWVLERCMPSFLVNGVFFVKLIAVDEFEQQIAEYNRWLDDEGVPALVRDWDRAVVQAREDLGRAARDLGIDNPWRKDKYPNPGDLRSRFGIEHSWVTFGVPETLPDEIRAREAIKIEAKYADAAEKIEQAVMEGFQDILRHAIEQLTPRPGEKKVVKQALVDNFRAFCDSFRFRNLNDNAELDQMVAQAEGILSGTSAQQLRDNSRVRSNVVREMSKVKEAIDQMITNAPRRALFLDDDEA
jgi:hypothetical protein